VLGVAALALLIWAVVFHLLPAFDLGLLDLAEQVAALNLPAKVIVPVGRALGYF